MTTSLPPTQPTAPERLIFSDSMGDRLFRIEHHHEGLRDVSFHFHPQYELTLVRGSAGLRVVGDHHEPFADFDLVLLGPNLPHGWSPNKILPPMRAIQYRVIVFSRESLGPDFLSRMEIAPLIRLLNRAARGLAFPPGAAQEAAQAWPAIERATGLKRVAAFLSLMHRLAHEPGARVLASDVYMTGGLERWQKALSTALLFALSHQSPTPRLSEVAAHVGMSVPTFTRFFKRMTDASFVQYVNRHRLNRACVLLRETNRSVLDISLLTGYENLSHFNRQFRRLTGMTPTDYRAARTKNGRRRHIGCNRAVDEHGVAVRRRAAGGIPCKSV